MRYEVKNIKIKDSMDYAELHLFIQDMSDEIEWKKRPTILICPGGGYFFTSDREADPIAFQFLAMGYNAAVLRYSTTPAKYPTALLELCNSMLLLRENADEYNIDPNQIYVLGFSAGGHLAASLGVFWKTDNSLSDYFKVDADKIKPNGLILCYPVITSGEYAHRGSFDLLTENNPELLEKLSLEYQVNQYVPKTFIWHTFDDSVVPLENTLLFVNALRKNNIQFEYHVFPTGHHGLSLATRQSDSGNGNDIQPDCAKWIDLCKSFIENN